MQGQACSDQGSPLCEHARKPSAKLKASRMGLSRGNGLRGTEAQRRSEHAGKAVAVVARIEIHANQAWDRQSVGSPNRIDSNACRTVSGPLGLGIGEVMQSTKFGLVPIRNHQSRSETSKHKQAIDTHRWCHMASK